MWACLALILRRTQRSPYFKQLCFSIVNMITRSKNHTIGHENTERWLLTYADMITLLTAFFLMLYSMSVMSKGKFTQMAISVRSGFGGVKVGGTGILPGRPTGQAEGIRPSDYHQFSAAMVELHDYVEQHHLRGKVRTRSDERGLIVSLLADDLLFAPGRAELQAGNSRVLTQVAKMILASPNQVQIEGHTDDLPIHTGQFPSNWELSTARAGTLLRYFTANTGLAARRFIASGYADTRPLVPNTSAANRAQNRRVDIILLKTDAQRELELRREAEVRRILAVKAPSGSTTQDDSAARKPNGSNPPAPDPTVSRETTLEP